MTSLKEFEFPLSDINDLKVASDDKYYVEVKDDPVRGSVAAQQNILTDIEDRLSRRPLQLFAHENFDPLYMFIIKLKTLSSSIKTCLVEVLSAISTPLLNKVNGSVDNNERKYLCRNCIKMLSFLLCVIVRTLEREARSNQETSSITSSRHSRKSKKKKKSKRNHETDIEYNWKKGKESIFAILCDILRQKSLVRLWDLNSPSEHFGNLFFNTAMSAMENPKNHSLASSNTIQSQMFDLIGLSLSAYSTNVSASNQLIRMLQTNTSNDTKLCIAIAELIRIIITKYNQALILHEMMTEIGHLNGKDLSRDTRGTKNLGFFLKQLADRCPKQVLSKISLVVNHLDEESYVMRNGIVVMIGSLIQHLNDEEKDKKVKNDLLDMLETRILDINSYTRSKVLQTWSHLIEEKIVPVHRLCATLIPLFRDRLQDKAALVRKQAIQILTVIVKNNPWGPLELDNDKATHDMNALRERITDIENSLSEIELKLSHKLLKKQGIEFETDENENEEEKMEIEQDVNHNKKRKKRKRSTKRRLNVDSDSESGDDSDENMTDLTSNDNENEEEEESLEEMVAKIKSFDDLKTQRKQLMMLELLVLFTGVMSECAVKTSLLLSSKTQSDVLECIEFFKIACCFKISHEKLGFERMLPLIWNKDNNQITFNVLKAYHYKFIQFTESELNNINDDEKQSKESMKIAINLIKLTNGATLADITCIEELIRLLVLNGDDAHRRNKDRGDITIPNRVYSALWWIFEGKLRDVTVPQRRGALDILRMAGVAKKSIILTKIESIVDIAFGDIAQNDAGMARSGCMALNVVFQDAIANDAVSCAMKQQILGYISYILRGGFIQSKHWFATCQEAINLLFSSKNLCPRPDLLIQNIIKTIALHLFNKDKEDTQAQANEEEDNRIFYKRYDLAKFLFILGNTAIKLLVYIESKEIELKKLKEKRSENDKVRKNNKKKKNDSQNENEAQISSANDNNDDDTDYELNEAMGGSGVEDYEIEQMKNRAEMSIVDNESLLGKFTPIILHIIGDPQQYNCSILQSSAVLAFTKFMCISSRFCNSNNLQILFTLLEKHNDPSIRANIIIALGDMAFRFPNELDQWSTYIYRNLRDNNVIVRKNTLMVLTHLILNDMIKVRDSISEIALLLEDPVASISDLARLFFQELSKKGKNPIYNILPDTISRFCNNESVSESTFKFIMKFLLAFITRDKQKENLIEKLCNRYNSSTDIKSWRYISYCLSLLSFSERLMKKICDEELVKKYADKLYDDEIFTYFKEIQSKCRKHVTPQYKETFDSWSEFIAQKHEKQKGDVQADERGNTKLERVKNKNKKRKKRKKRQESDDEDDDDDIDMILESDNDDDDDDDDGSTRSPSQKENKTTNVNRRPRRKRRKKNEIESSEEESESESESASPVKAKGSRGRGRGRGRGRAAKRRGRGRGRAKGRGRGRGRGRATKSSKREEDESSSSQDLEYQSESIQEEESSVEEEQ